MKYRITICFLLLICCTQNRIIDKHIEYFSSKFKLFPKNGWKVTFNNSNKGIYKIGLNINKEHPEDTVYQIIYEYDKKTGNFNVIKNSLMYRKGQYFYLLEYREKPLYLIKSFDPSFVHKDFIYGKYYYEYLMNSVNENQKRYFERHKDSLIKIPGNNLIDLPEE